MKKEWKKTLRSLKEQKRTECSDRKRTRCPTLPNIHLNSAQISEEVFTTGGAEIGTISYQKGTEFGHMFETKTSGIVWTF